MLVYRHQNLVSVVTIWNLSGMFWIYNKSYKERCVLHMNYNLVTYTVLVSWGMLLIGIFSCAKYSKELILKSRHAQLRMVILYILENLENALIVRNISNPRLLSYYHVSIEFAEKSVLVWSKWQKNKNCVQLITVQKGFQKLLMKTKHQKTRSMNSFFLRSCKWNLGRC